MDENSRIRNRLLAVIAAVICTEALRVSYPVTMPLAVAFIVIAAIWPIKPWLDCFLPTSLSYLGAILVLTVVCAGFIAAVYFSAAQMVAAFDHNWSSFSAAFESVSDWAQQWGLPVGGKEGYNRLVGFGRGLLENVYTTFGYLGFIAVLVVFGLPEVTAMRTKLRQAFGTAEHQEVLEAVDAVATKIRMYLGVTTLTSLLTGVATGVFGFLVGLDLALVWGVLNFLLNYIPVVGNLVGIIPPALYAVVQFQNTTMPLVVFIGLGVIQLAISNIVYPILQGYSLSLSPVMILLSLSFWSWVWGIAGALIAVPLTAALVITCEHFPATRWIARLLARPDNRGKDST
ncbi:AI-2E family transporter [Bradyrhizobium sp. P5_C11_2]